MRTTLIALTGILACAGANAELLSQVQWNVLDTDTNLEWRGAEASLQTGEIHSGQYVGSYNDVISRYDADSTYRLPTAAEVDDLLAKLFPGFVASDAEGRCSESVNGTGGYPGLDAQVDDYFSLFGYGAGSYNLGAPDQTLYEMSSGELRALWVSRTTYSSTNTKVCLTGPRNSYEGYRNHPSYPSTLLPVLVVRDAIDRKAPSLTLFSYLAPEEVGLSAQTLLFGTVQSPDYGPYYVPTDNNWTSPVYGPDYSGQTFFGEFQLAAHPSFYSAGALAPWVRVNSLEYTGPCTGGDADIGGGWCRRTVAGAEYQFTGEPVIFPGTYVDNQGVVDNIEIDQIWANMVVDYNPWNTENTIGPKQPGWSIYIEIETTSTADGEAYDFDASIVDPSTLMVGPGLATPLEYAVTDIDGDGDNDVTFRFRAGDTGIGCLDTSITLAGRTYGGAPIAGTDMIAPIGCEETVDIDVDPFNSVNTIRPNDNYNVTVAVLGMRTAAGDPIDLYPGATTANGVDAESLRLGAAATPGIGTPIITDIDGDSYDDILINFNVFDAGIACGDTELELIGNMNSGLPIEGFDTIVTEDCSTSVCHP